MLKKKEQLAEDVYLGLSADIKFTAGDLEANRAGFISHRQKKQQLKSIWMNDDNALALIGGLVFIPTAICAGYATFRNPSAGVCAAPIGTFVVLLTLISFYHSFGRSWPLFSDVRAGKVEKSSYRKSEELDGDFRSPLKYAYLDILKPNTRYQIYFLPKSGEVISYEELDTLQESSFEASPEKRKEALNDNSYYGKAFDFYISDLTDNRAGFISQRQLKRHRERFFEIALYLLTLFYGPALGFGVLLGISLYFAITVESSDTSLIATIFCLWLSVFLAIFLRYQFKPLINFYRDMRGKRVQRISGRIKPFRKNLKTHSLIIGDEHIDVDELQFGLGWKKSIYAVYMLPYSKKILSIEELFPA